MKENIQHKNTSLVYYKYGKGMPVILLHGFAETNAIWNKQVEYLSSYCMLLIPDLPGSGDSLLLEVPEKKLSIEDLAESISSILKKENIEQCIMLGHSMGGYVTLAFAEKFPHKLKAFGFVQSTAFADSAEKKQNRLKGIDMIENYGSYAFLKNSTPNLFAEKFKKEHPDEVNALIEAGKDFAPKNLQQYYYAMMQRSDRTQVLKNSRLPVLFVIGEQDAAVPLNDILKQVHLPEIAYIHIIENVSHMSMLEAPDKLNVILKNFVNALE